MILGDAEGVEQAKVCTCSVWAIKPKREYCLNCGGCIVT